MTDKNDKGSEANNNFFNNLMFGPPRQPVKEESQQPKPEKGQESEENVNEGPPQPTQTSDVAKQENNSVAKENNSEPEIDMVQMMQSFDTLMEYANKLGPSLKKLGPLVDLLKQFSGPKR